MNHVVKSMLSLCVFILTVFASCINREFDSNDEFKHSKSIALNADNDRLLSRIFIINENKSYLWFDLNNEVANFSKPQFTLPIIEGGKNSFRNLPLRGLIYEYKASENELTFKNVPEQFVQMGNDQLSLTFKLSMTDGKEVVLPNKKVVETSKKQYLLTLVRLQFASDNATFNVGEKIKRGGRTYEFLPFKTELTLIN